MSYHNLAIYFFVGLILITVIDTIGAIASRKMNFNYAYLSVLSFAVYITIAYLASADYRTGIVLFLSSLLGLYDGTVGFWLSIVLKSNNGKTTEETSEKPGLMSAVTMIIIAIILGLIGNGLSYKWQP